MKNDARNQIKFYMDPTWLVGIWFFFVGIYMNLFMRLTVTGLENLPTDRGVVLSANHLEQVDSFLLVHAMPRHIFFMAKDDIFERPAWSAVLRRLGAFPVHRDRMDRWALRHAQKLIEHGCILGIYPEGERSKTNTMQEGKVGPAYLAIKSKAPIVPVAIIGTNRMFENFPRRTDVSVQVGEPIYRKEEEDAYELTDRLMHTIAAMLPPEMRGVYG